MNGLDALDETPDKARFCFICQIYPWIAWILLASIPLFSPVYIWPTFPRWRSLQLPSHLPCIMTCAQHRGRTWKGGGKQREAKQPNALRRSSIPPSAPRVWRMLPHPRPDQRRQMIANASWRPLAKWEPNQALFLEPASHSFSTRLFVVWSSFNYPLLVM